MATCENLLIMIVMGIAISRDERKIIAEVRNWGNLIINIQYFLVTLRRSTENTQITLRRSSLPCQ